MTIAEFAPLVGVTPGAISSALIRGSLTMSVLESYAKALDLPVWELLVCGGVNEKPEKKTKSKDKAKNKIVLNCPQCGSKLQLSISVKTL